MVVMIYVVAIYSNFGAKAVICEGGAGFGQRHPLQYWSTEAMDIAVKAVVEMETS